MGRTLKWVAVAMLALLGGLAFAYWTPDTDAVAMRTKYATDASQFVDIGDGLTVHLRDEGPRDAPVVMLLHGSNASLQTWDFWTGLLVPRYRVVRLDLPGHGLTGADPARAYSTAAFVSVVDRTARKLGIGSFVLAGSSMGGGVAWAFAHSHSDRLRGLVLIDATGAPEHGEASLPVGFRLAGTPGVRTLMQYLTPRSLIEDGLRQSVTDQAIVTAAMIDRYWELLRYPGNRPATIDRFATPLEPAIVTSPPKAIPALIMWGADDRLIPAASATWFENRLPGSKVIIYPAVGHLMMEEIPQRSASDLSNWLASLPAAR